MRTRTDGDYAYRLGVIGFAMDALDENTRTAVHPSRVRAREAKPASEGEDAGAPRQDTRTGRHP
ncbi:MULTISPECIES: DUF7692 domain-containing protein [Halobacterium]